MNINEKYKELITDLESNMESKKDFEYVKNAFSGIFLDFLTELQDLYNQNLEKMQELEEKQKEIEKKSALMEDSLNKIEKELYITDNDNYDFEFVCPYCNCEFEAEADELRSEITCPECHNIIELDWNEECEGDCSCCHGNCEEEKEIQIPEDEDEDM